jgi:vacuolar-type H+-ATPase subunit F/Vma7
VNGDIFSPEVDGLEGVIESYKNAINTINFYGPTYFAPVIKMVVDMAESERVS